jgi:GMP synthase (glutamine-hydrolysing)
MVEIMKTLRVPNVPAEQYAKEQIAQIREKVGSGQVLLGLSGGVDSSVCAAMLSKAIGKQLTCIFVDHGLMRKNEAREVKEAFSDFDFNLVMVDAEERFLNKLKGVTDPERKRKIIGEEFIRVFEQTSSDLFSKTNNSNENVFLAQGTIYPDIVESKGVKSHHNVGGLPENVNFCEIVEPLRELYKDEVREIGTLLGLPNYLVERQPFPGPGLAVRCIGELTKEKLELLRDVDAIFREEVEKSKVESNQFFAALLDMKSVGVKDGKRTYGYVTALRAVKTIDFMNAEIVHLPWELLEKVVTRISDEVDGISRVVYDITGKPPGTIEWE